MNGAEVFPSQAQVHRQVWFQFEVILRKERINVAADVFLYAGWLSGARVKGAAFLGRRVIAPIPQVVELVARRQPGPGGGILYLILVVIRPKLERVASV